MRRDNPPTNQFANRLPRLDVLAPNPHVPDGKPFITLRWRPCAAILAVIDRGMNRGNVPGYLQRTVWPAGMVGATELSGNTDQSTNATLVIGESLGLPSGSLRIQTGLRAERSRIVATSW